MKSIVIIDDDPEAQEIFYGMLIEKDFRVFPAGSGRLGLKVVQHERPHLVILDIMLPGDMNGLHVLDRLKKSETTKHIPVLVMSNLDSVRDTAMEKGAAAYLTKLQTSVDTLLAKIEALTAD